MKKSNKKLFGYNTNKEKLYSVYLNTINGILKLTSKELSVAARLYTTLEEISKGVTDTKIQNDLLFSVSYKKRMREELGGMSALLMNNYISALKDKKIIVEKDGQKMMNEALRVDVNSSEIEIKFKFNLG